MKLSDRLRELSTRFSTSAAIQAVRVVNPGQPLTIRAQTPHDVACACFDFNLGTPNLALFEEDRLWLCFAGESLEKFEIIIETNEPDNFWKELKKALQNEFANRFTRI